MQPLKIEEAVTVNENCDSKKHETNDHTYSKKRKDDTDYNKNINKQKERNLIIKGFLENKKNCLFCRHYFDLVSYSSGK